MSLVPGSGRRASPDLQGAGTMSAVNVISYEELKKLNASGKSQIFDVRSPEEVQRGKIPNSVNIPVDQIEHALKMDPETFKKTYDVDKPKLEENNIVVHCHMGKRGARAADIAAALGYTQYVYSVICNPDTAKYVYYTYCVCVCVCVCVYTEF
ncbi:hypothetical protein FKM82_019506 [Ascaphus truei]